MDKTPSGPTLSIASAIIAPMSSSFPAEMVATADNMGKIISFKEMNYFVKIEIKVKGRITFDVITAFNRPRRLL